MKLRKLAFATAAVILASIGSAAVGSASADGPRAQKIDLGGIRGVAYYVEEAGRFRVVATLAQQEGVPFRVETALEPGQSVVLSSPNGAAGLTRVELRREADILTVRPVAATH